MELVVCCCGKYLGVQLAIVWTNSLNMKQDDSEGLTASKQLNNSRHDMVVTSLIVNTFSSLVLR